MNDQIQQDGREGATTNRAEIDIPAEYKGLFSEPPMLEGDNPELYRQLLSAIIRERSPDTLDDWIAISDLITKLWEERLLRRASNALIRSGMYSAAKHFLDELRDGEEHLKKLSDSPARRATRYFSTKQRERDEVRSFLAPFGITSTELYAKSAQMNGEAVQMFEEMINSRERGRRKLRKQDERRLRGQSSNRTIQ